MTSPSFDPFEPSRTSNQSSSVDAQRAAGGTGYNWRTNSNATGGGDWATSSRPTQVTGVASGVRAVVQAGRQRITNNSSTGFVPDPSQATQDGVFGPAGENYSYYSTPIRPYTSGRKGRSGAAFLANAPKIASARTFGEVYAAFWSDPASRELINNVSRAVNASYPNWNPQWAEGTLKDLLNASLATGNNPMMIADMILSGEIVVGGDGTIAGSSGGGYYGGGGGYGGGSSTQRTIDLTSPQQARGLLMQTIQGVLGRNPTDTEYDEFVKILNETQTANPSVVSAAGDTVTRTGGVDAGLVALDYAESRDDYEDVQANQYYNMFLDVLAGG